MPETMASRSVEVLSAAERDEALQGAGFGRGVAISSRHSWLTVLAICIVFVAACGSDTGSTDTESAQTTSTSQADAPVESSVVTTNTATVASRQSRGWPSTCSSPRRTA